MITRHPTGSGARFADGVRARLGGRAEPYTRGAATVLVRPIVPARPFRPSPSPSPVRVDVTVHLPSPVAAPRTVPRTVLRTERHTRTAAAPGRERVLLRSVRSSSSRSERERRETHAHRQERTATHVVRHDRVETAVGRPPASAAIVLRAPAAAPASAERRAEPVVPASPTVRAAAGTPFAGAGPGPGASPAAPLTGADLPVVVDRVVRELDRRLVAARERRGAFR